MSKTANPAANPWSSLGTMRQEPTEDELLDRTGKADSIDASRHLVRGDRFTESFMMGTNGGAMFEPLLRPAAPSMSMPPAREADPAGPAQPGGPPRGRVAHNVLGLDDRVLIRDTTLIPACSIGLLKIAMRNGSTRWGTAWLIGPRTLATAAHNLLHPDDGPASGWTVYLAYDGNRARGGEHKIVADALPDAWKEDPRIGSPYDFAVLKIADAAVGNAQGWFGYADYDDAKFDKLALNLFGYPMNVDEGQQYCMFAAKGRALRADGGHIFYDCDAGPGMSGGPVYARFGEQRIAVGIHIGGGDASSGNVATRINDVAHAMFKAHESW